MTRLTLVVKRQKIINRKTPTFKIEEQIEANPENNWQVRCLHSYWNKFVFIYNYNILLLLLAAYRV